MLNVTEYSVELIKDPFKILTGERYEFLLDIEVDEDDELYSQNGLYIRAIYHVEESRASIIKYDIIEKITDEHLDFDLEQDEEEQLLAFCKDNSQKNDK
ncbi:DUF6509 family protein [Paenibacillus eucommiae]|uniref:Pullulanase n=1 Tax=Paenibacillus eucommiae TaxID=1355755 RepID=A0ABS4JAK4_9BACL|nr:DUF6509 family protein [Paenibacillus eucommiae]MBP1996876.1 hypothetical protein [Paenibacillus eucommiae]